MKKFYLFAAAAVLLTACVKTQNVDEVATIGTDETTVSFDVYTARATKARLRCICLLHRQQPVRPVCEAQLHV